MFRINYLLLGHRKGYLALLSQIGEGDRGSGRAPIVRFSITLFTPPRMLMMTRRWKTKGSVENKMSSVNN